MPIVLALLVLLLATAAAPAAAKAPSLTVKTSLGAVTEDDERPLRARGRAPRGSKLVARFYRGDKRLATTKPRPKDGRYSTDLMIDRTGAYRVVVVATTPAGRELRVSATLKYGPKAEAPSAPTP